MSIKQRRYWQTNMSISRASGFEFIIKHSIGAAVSFCNVRGSHKMVF